MPNQSTAPDEADALRHWAQAIAHARIPVALKLLLLALLAAFPMAGTARRSPRAPRKDWFLSAYFNVGEDPASDLSPHELRQLRRARAVLGWLLRGLPNRGMSMLGYRTPVSCPPQSARAPP